MDALGARNFPTPTASTSFTASNEKETNMGKVHRSAASGRFVKASTARRHPKTTVSSTLGGRANGYRSAITGRFVTKATATRHPANTIKETR
jgi:hypothetical protein